MSRAGAVGGVGESVCVCVWGGGGGGRSFQFAEKTSHRYKIILVSDVAPVHSVPLLELLFSRKWNSSATEDSSYRSLGS